MKKKQQKIKVTKIIDKTKELHDHIKSLETKVGRDIETCYHLLIGYILPVIRMGGWCVRMVNQFYMRQR